jgi:hypothetical protein
MNVNSGLWRVVLVALAGLGLLAGLGVFIWHSVTFPNSGILLVALVALGLVLALALFDARFIQRNGQPVGRWVQAWARRFPILAFLLAAVLGMLVGHFFWSTPPVCPAEGSAHGVTAGTDLDCTPAQPNPSPRP